MHSFETVIRLQHTDAAGVVFFARYFELAHLAFEDMLDAIGQPLPTDLANASLILPIVHAEADYKAALRLGDPVHIDVGVKDVRSRSFSLAFRVSKPDDSVVATLLVVHAFVDTKTGEATDLPDDFVDALQAV